MSKLSLLALAAVVMASSASAQDAPLPASLAPATRALLQQLIDSVGALGVPRKPLADKAAEGVLKGAEADRIVRAVRSLAQEIETARGALDGTNDLALLGAAAGALHAGVSANDLRRLAHPAGASADPPTLATALVTLVDLVSKRIPVDVATLSIQSMIDRRANEKQFRALRSDVARDVLAGQSPEASLAARTRAQLRITP
ncbi:MAG TPA: hypothetical protein VN706_16080 [Gemmatimonadaceae bacterium]|nr:hypothetical protein [Gemmatimonadaceae bacterium]